MEEEQYKFEDFLHLTLTSLQDYLALRGLSKSGNKEVLVARAFGAYELNAPIKFTQKQILNELKEEYQRRLRNANNAPDPREVPREMWKDDVVSWPDFDEGKLFSFILKNKAVLILIISESIKTRRLTVFMKVALLDACTATKSHNLT